MQLFLMKMPMCNYHHLKWTMWILPNYFKLWEMPALNKKHAPPEFYIQVSASQVTITPPSPPTTVLEQRTKFLTIQFGIFTSIILRKGNCPRRHSQKPAAFTNYRLTWIAA